MGPAQAAAAADPTAAHRARADHRVLSSPLAVALAALLGPTIRASHGHDPHALLVAALGTAAVITLARVEDRWAAARLAVLVGVGSTIAVAEGGLLGWWAPLAVLIADWGMARRRPVPWLRAADPAAAGPVAALLLLSAVPALDPGMGSAPLRPVLLAAVVAIVGSTTGDLLTRTRRRIRPGVSALATRLLAADVPDATGASGTTHRAALLRLAVLPLLWVAGTAATIAFVGIDHGVVGTAGLLRGMAALPSVVEAAVAWLTPVVWMVGIGIAGAAVTLDGTRALGRIAALVSVAVGVGATTGALAAGLLVWHDASGRFVA